MSDPFNLLIRLSNGQRLEVTIDGDNVDTSAITVLKVKEIIATKDSTAAVDRQRLIYKGRILDNDRSLSDYSIGKGATLFMVKSAGPPAATTPTTSTTTAAAPTTPTPAPTTTSANLMPLPGFAPSMFGQPQGPQGMPNPEQMQAMLNSPHMQGLLDNPDLLGSMLEQSMQTPQMQQLMQQNPELRQLYNDPAMIQQAIQMMRNPQHMQQVMRQQDLAMSQLENMPGGFAALSNMYRNVQEPMMEAQQASRQTPSETRRVTNNASSAEGATGAPMPNPWGSPAPAPRPTNNAFPTNPFAAPPNPWASGAAAPPNPFGMPGGGAAAGMPNPFGMPGGMPPPNMDQIMTMLDNPVMSQMMNDMVQNNPDMIRTMLEAQNPMLRDMFAGNPEMANNFIRNMFDPQNMRQMVEMQRAMGGGGMGGGMPMGMPPFGMMPPGGGGARGGAGEVDFSNLLQQFQQTGLGAARGSSGATPHRADPVNPADRYRFQLQSLYDMGFDDEQANLAALQANHGNLNRAVDQLLTSPPPAPSESGNNSSSDNNGNATQGDKQEEKSD